jgi:membrane protease YdiL (CAAX protease family)
VITDRQPVGWGRAVFLSITLFVLLFLVEGFAAGPLTHKHTSLVAGIAAAIAVAGAVVLILPLCFELAFANRRRDWALFGAARARRWISGIAIFIPAAFVVGSIAILLTAVLHLTGTTEIKTSSSSYGFKVAIFTLAVIVAPWTEEVGMRGFLFSGLARRFGFWPAAFVSGAVWAGLHLTPGVLILFTAEGMLLAWLRARTGSLLPGIGLHGTWNAFAAAISGGGWFPVPMLALLYGSIYLAYRAMPETALLIDAGQAPVPAQ